MTKFPTSLKFCIFADVLIFFPLSSILLKWFIRLLKEMKQHWNTHMDMWKNLFVQRKKHYWAWTKTLFDDYLLCTDYFDQKPEQLRTLTWLAESLSKFEELARNSWPCYLIKEPGTSFYLSLFTVETVKDFGRWKIEMDVYSGLVVNFVEAKGVHSITF